MDGGDIKRRRKAAGLSQAALAEKVGVTQGAVSSWETGLVCVSLNATDLGFDQTASGWRWGAPRRRLQG
jgi:DNA-binding transcriptional regulator YiaG